MTQHKHESAIPQSTPAETLKAMGLKFIKQRKEIEELYIERRAGAQLSQMDKGPRGKRRNMTPMNITIKLPKGRHHVDGRPLVHMVRAKYTLLQCSTECVLIADVASSKAIIALQEGRFEDYLNLFAEAERCLGACIAWSSAAGMQSLTAAFKSKQSRAEIDIWKERVLDYWRKHIDPTYSAETAAGIIETQYLSKQTEKEISGRTLAKWVRAEKKAKTISPPEVARKPLRLY